MNLFAELEAERRRLVEPLAYRMRPRALDEFVGQSHFLGEGKLLRRMLLADRISSAIFYGPPGSGKTTLALLIARHTKARFAVVNAAGAGIKEVRAELDAAKTALEADGQRTLLFLDEIHHFNRTQQDILLPDVENGTISLIGATTQNPFFSINAPLISRSQVFHFEPLTREEIETIIRRAILDRERGLGNFQVEISDDAICHWSAICDGDARRALNALEIAVRSFPPGRRAVIDLKTAEDSIQRKAIGFDRSGDDHYDLASAFIKSMRGSDPDAAIYWLARMLESGEEPRFIARRLVIFASEDVGCADSTALAVAIAAHHAVEFVGLPECQLHLAHATLHLATAPKSNSATKAIGRARKDVREGRTLAVPLHLRDAHYAGAGRLDHGKGYLYPHDFPNAHVEQQYLPEPAVYYEPTDRGAEAEIGRRLAQRRAAAGDAQPGLEACS